MLLEDESAQGRSAAGKNKKMKNAEEPNRILANEFSVCRRVPQITALPPTPFINRLRPIYENN
jgi:hypothetical protein